MIRSCMTSEVISFLHPLLKKLTQENETRILRKKHAYLKKMIQNILIFGTCPKGRVTKSL